MQISPWFSELLKSGLNDEQPYYINRSVLVANKTALGLVAFICVPFFTIALIYMPQVMYIPVLGAVFTGFVILFNYWGLNSIGRFILAVVPGSLVCIWHAQVRGVGEPPILLSMMLELSVSFVPFLVFDFREKILLWSALTINFFVLIGHNVFNQLLESGLDSTIYRSGIIQQIGVITAILAAFSTLYIMMFQNNDSEKRVETVVKNMKINNEKLKNSEIALQKKLSQFESIQTAEKERNWMSEGLAKFTKIIQTEKSLLGLGDEIISNLVQYMDLNQGGIYILEGEGEGENKYLKLLSCYAFDRKKHHEQKIEIGSGLLGQTYLEGKYRYLEEVPQNYITISSGLGESSPSALLIMPMMANNQVHGLIEVASFKPIPDSHIEFLSKLGEQIASAISTTKANDFTKNLLQETQMQAEQMQAQEEEMRQNMEELQATQEEMSRKENGYLDRIKELENKYQTSN